MSKYEKLGSYLLFEKTDEDKLSKNFVAGQIVENQIKQIQMIKKFDHSLSTTPDFIMDLNQGYEILKSLSNPNIARPNLFIQEKSEFAAVFDYVEGKSLRSVLSKCAQDGFPFTVDHSLLIASRLCSALEYLHSKKVNDQRLVHGFVCPETILVTYDGEIKLQYMGLVHALMKFPAGRDKFFHDYKNYLAPETMDQQKLGKNTDIFGAGLVLFEMLTGEALFAKGRNVNLKEAIGQANMYATSGDRLPLTDELKNVLKLSLGVEAGEKYESVGDMRKALDLLLFSSEFSPTTFNLAFFMNSLFRESIDEENKNLTGWKRMDVSSYIKEEPPPPSKPEHPVGATAAKDMPIPITPEKAPQQVFPPPQQEIFGAAAEEKRGGSKLPLIIGGVIGAGLIGVLAVYFFPSGGDETPASTQTVQQQQVSPEQLKEQEEERQRLRDEASKAQEDAKKKDQELADLKSKLDELVKAQQQQAKQQKTGTTPEEKPVVDTAAIQKLQEQARKLEEEKKKQEALAEQKLKEAEKPVPQPPQEKPAEETKLAQGTTPAVPGPTDTEAPVEQEKEAAPVEAPPPPEVKEGDEVQLTGDMVKPVIISRVNPEYPPVARAKKIEGTVILNVFISERGEVLDVKVLRAAGGSSGLNEAAMSAVRRWKFSPAVKQGKRVKVWYTIPVVFRLQG